MERRIYSWHSSQLFQRAGYLYGNGNGSGSLYINGQHLDHTEYDSAISGYQQSRRYGTDLHDHFDLRNSNGWRYLFLERRSHTGYSSQLFQCTGYLHSNGNEQLQWLYGYCQHLNNTEYDSADSGYQ